VPLLVLLALVLLPPLVLPPLVLVLSLESLVTYARLLTSYLPST
jgi:hypothetical protein